MQYLVSVIDDKTGSATPDEMVAIDAFNDPATGTRERPVPSSGWRRPGLRSRIRVRTPGGRAVLGDDRAKCEP